MDTTTAPAAPTTLHAFDAPDALDAAGPRPRTTRSRRKLRRRLAAGAVALATLGGCFGLAVGPVSAMPRNPCSDARNAFRAAMNEARFWIGAADKLAAAGNGSAADAASAEANFYLGQAQDALGSMQASC